MKVNKKERGKKILSALILIAFIAIVFISRYRNLGLPGLTGDEIVTARVPNFLDTRCYIYSFIMNYYARIIIFISGKDFLDETLLRIPSVFASVLTVPVLWSLGKKIKDATTSIVLLTLFSFSLYLIGYGRDARFYAFYFLATCLVLSYVTVILSIKPFENKKDEYLTYILYALSMIFCMGIHQGSYLFYALSNLFLGTLITITLVREIFTDDKFKAIKDYFFKILILLLPLLSCLWHLTKISQGKMANNLKATGYLLGELSWNAINDLESSYWGLYPYQSKILLIITFFSLILLATKRYRCLSLYCLFVKFGTFLFLRFLPQAIVKEPLREKYILFILSIDFLVLGAGISLTIEYFGKLVTFYTGKFRTYFYNAITILLTLFFSFYLYSVTWNNIWKHKIYLEERSETRKVANILDQVSTNDVIIIFGTDSGINHVLEFEKRRYPNRKCWNFISNPNTYKMIKNSNNDGYVWYIFSGCSYDCKEYIEEKYYEGVFAIYKSKARISDDKTKIIALTKYILNSNPNMLGEYGTIRSFLSSTRELKNLDEIVKEFASEYDNTNNIYFSSNLIRNGDFSQKQKGWNIISLKKKGEISYSNSENDPHLILKYFPGTQFGLAQAVNVKSGKYYRVSAKVRNDSKHNNMLLGAYLNIWSKNVNLYIKFYDSCPNWTSQSLRFFSKHTETVSVSVMTGFANINGETIADITDVSFVEEMSSPPSKSISVSSKKAELQFEDINLVKNGDFQNGLKNWNSWKFKDDDILPTNVTREADYNFVTVYNPNKSLIGFCQAVNMVSGNVYKISGKARLSKNNKTNIKYFGARLALYAPGQKEIQVIWEDPLEDWINKSLIFTNRVSTAATIYFHMGYFKDYINGDFTDIKIQKEK